MDISRKFFIGFSLPEEAERYARTIADDVHNTFGIKNVLDKFIPHVTLKVTFVAHEHCRFDLIDFLEKFTRDRRPIPIELRGFGHFNIGVIYLDVLEDLNGVTLIQQELCSGLESYEWVTFDRREPTGIPHVNVGEGDIRGRFVKIYDYLTSQYPHGISTELKNIHLFEKAPHANAWEIVHTCYLQ
jgi:2'-5' RNA ligase